MDAKTGEIFYEVATHVAPGGLVAEPEDVPRCVAILKGLTPLPGKGKAQPQPTVAQLTSKCDALYRSIKVETLAYLVSSYWSLNFDAAHGIVVSEAEVNRDLDRIERERFHSPGEFQQYLTNRRRTLAEELFTVRMDLLQQKVERKFQNANAAIVSALANELRSQADSAKCRPGYVVEYCRGYTPQAGAEAADTSSPSVLLEEIARWRPETSHGFTGLPIS
jgi:hypothetical protein